MTFPIRPRHIPGEPASGYARRLAEANGYDWRSNPFAGRGVSTALLARGNTRALVAVSRARDGRRNRSILSSADAGWPHLIERREAGTCSSFL